LAMYPEPYAAFYGAGPLLRDSGK